MPDLVIGDFDEENVRRGISIGMGKAGLRKTEMGPLEGENNEEDENLIKKKRNPRKSKSRAYLIERSYMNHLF